MEQHKSDDEDDFERQESEDEDLEREDPENKVTVQKAENEEVKSKEIEKLTAKRSKLWWYYRSIHAKSTNERHFATDERAFLE